MRLEVRRGLDIPLKGKPSTQIEELKKSDEVALNLEPFDHLSFKLLVKVGENVKIGQPLLENKSIAGQYFVSPASGMVKEVRRGVKRRILDLVIQVSDEESYHKLPPLSSQNASKDEILARFLSGGLCPHIQKRPFLMIANPSFLPRDIFVSGVETLPYTPPAHVQIEGYEHYFQEGLDILSKITTGKVHLIYRDKPEIAAFHEARSVEKHHIRGPHPAGNLSFAIHRIAPIRHTQECVWTLSALDVVVIGRMFLEGIYHTPRIVAVGGEGAISERRKYYKTRMGVSIRSLIEGYVEKGPIRILSGDPLMGQKVSIDDFLGFHERVISVLCENHTREPFHFFRLGLRKFSATRAYLSGHKKPWVGKEYSFTTNQHGEHRAFIDGKIYDKVMPLAIPTMLLVKAILAEDFTLAEELGALEVAPEDFALPTFICPSKMEMVDIVKQGLRRHAIEVGVS